MDFVTGVVSNTKAFVTSLSVDVLTVTFLFVLFFFIGMREGKSHLIGFLVSIYIAGFLYILFPFRDNISFDFGLFANKYNIVDITLLFMAIGVLQIMASYILEIEFGERRIMNAINLTILSASSVAGSLAVLYSIGAVRNIDTSLSFLDLILTNETYLFGLLIVPLVGIFITTR